MVEDEHSIGDGPTMRPQSSSGAERRFSAGETILGRYTVVRELGEGGMGVVYQCLDTVGGVEVAVKGLPPEMSRNEEEMEDIRANYQIVRNLRHPNIAGVTTLEKDADGGDYYLVMDLAHGTTLKRWAKRNAVAGIDAKIAILRQVAAALDYAHAEKVIHRDVKPENVMVDDEGRVKVLDFGLAAQIRSSQSRTSNAVTSKGGTPGYKSPEQWLGRPQKAPADVYAFGVMAYWLLAGRLPFDGDDPVVLGHAVLTAPVEPVEGLPAHMNAALAKALAKKPEERFASCGEFVDALGGAQLVAPATGGSRSRATVGILVAAALALAGGGAWFCHQEQQREQARIIAVQKAEAERKAEEVRKAKEEAEKLQREEVRRKAEEEAVKQRPDDAQQKAEEAKVRMAEFMQLKTRINIKVSDAKEKMERIGAFRADSDGMEAHIASADAQWKALSGIAPPSTLEEARSAFDLADKAETQVSLALDWLRKNKAGRDAAKAAEAEISALFAGDVTTFKADRYAPTPFGRGAGLRDQGQAAFKKGDFAEAGRLLIEAKTKFTEAAQEAKAFFVKTTLQSAQAYFDAGKWQGCITEADKVLGWEAGNESAAKLKKEAESHLVPTLHLLAKVDGNEVSAKVKAGDKEISTPFVWKLKEGSRYGPYEVSYQSGGKRYYGTIDSVMVDWRGVRVVPVVLKEYTGPKHGDTKTITLPGGATMEMIYVVSGTFIMGSLSAETGRSDDETQHRVALTKGFWLGKYEVTQAQWQSVMGENPSRFKGDNRPVEKVSWEDCQSFIRKINSAQNCEVRLPTEAEWEYACRAGSTGPFGGNGNLDDMGWYDANSGYETHPVGGKSANAWGFYDMHGNVWEWCGDWYGDYDGDTTDPTGPASGGNRVLRGGSWYGDARDCRSANRVRDFPGYGDDRNGLRLCCSAGLRE